MTVSGAIRRLKAAWKIVRHGTATAPTKMHTELRDVMAHLAKHGFSPATIIDVEGERRFERDVGETANVSCNLLRTGEDHHRIRRETDRRGCLSGALRSARALRDCACSTPTRRLSATGGTGIGGIEKCTGRGE